MPSPQLKILGEFFRIRRSEVPPDSVPDLVSYTHGHHRVAGLRREEVAQLAAISADY